MSHPCAFQKQKKLIHSQHLCPVLLSLQEKTAKEEGSDVQDLMVSPCETEEEGAAEEEPKILLD